MLTKIWSKIKRRIDFWKSYKAFRTYSDGRFEMKKSDLKPMYHDNSKATPFDAHYIYHPAWAARTIKKIAPNKHVDISSILSFPTMLSAFIPTEYFDFRPANIKLTNLSSEKADLVNLPFQTASIESISCMHTIEHIGLGRYGDPLDPKGDLKAINELIRVTKPGGSILFVVPIGQPRIQFNAHRIYSYDMVMTYFSERCILKEFSLIPDDAVANGMITNANRHEADRQKYGCGCFWFLKK